MTSWRRNRSGLPAAQAAAGLLPMLVMAASWGQPVAERPDLRAGDNWQFSAVSSTESKTTSWSRTIVQVLPKNRVEVRHSNDQVYLYDDALNWLGNSEDPRVLARYPMKVGDTWSFSRRFRNPGRGARDHNGARRHFRLLPS